MMSLIRKNAMIQLIPVLSETERQEMLDYFIVYEKYAKELSEMAIEDLKNHPVFGKLIRDTPKEISDENSKISAALQKDAIINDNWTPYIDYQIKQGIVYAKMGLDFKSWYEVVVLVKNYMRPYLHKEYGGSEKLYSSINGMNRLMDIAMSVIGEAYLEEKQEIILEDRKKIEELNKDLEQKVKERTEQLAFTNKELESKIEQLKKNEEQIKTSQKMFSTVFYKSPVMNSITDAETGRFIEINENFADFCDVAKEEIIGKSAIELNLIPHQEQRIRIIKSIKETGYSRDELMEIATVKGIKWVSSSAHLVNINGKDCFLTAMIDVTERKRSEQQLESVNKELEAFTYSVSHDLRAPLRAVNGYAQMLNEDYGVVLDEEGKRIIETIRYNATRMGTLIDDLLAFSRLGRKEILNKEINMNELTKGVISEMNKSISHNAKIKIGKLHNIKADYGLIHQVMFNLISNAVKYSSKKEKPVVEIFSEEKPGEIIYSVKDNGAGFNMQYSDKLFGVFQRLHSQDEFEGTGVGLAIVQRIISKHGGHVWGEGKINEGAVFNFSMTK